MQYVLSVLKRVLTLQVKYLKRVENRLSIAKSSLKLLFRFDKATNYYQCHTDFIKKKIQQNSHKYMC